MFGILQQVTTDPLGSALTNDAALAATVLTLDEIFEFDETGGEVLIAGTTYTYLSSDPDASTITLATGLLSAQVAGTPVDLFSPEGSVAVKWIAWVDVEDSDQPIEATIRTTDIADFSPPGDARAGTTVALERDAFEGYVVTSKVSELPDEDPAGVTAPDEALVLKVTGDATGLTAVVTGGIAPSTVLDWYLDGVLIYEGTRSTVERFEDEADADPMANGIDYTVSVQPRNSIDVGTMVTAAPTQLNPAVDSETVLAWVAAGFILAGTIQVGASMIFDSTGITITHPDGRQTYMRADGSGNQFVGQAILDAATITGNLTVLGDTSNLNGLVTLGSGVSDPTSKPGVTAAGWDSVSFGDPAGVTRGMFDNGTTWLFTLSLFGGDVRAHDKATGALGAVLFTLPAQFQPLGGVVKVGTNFYVLGKDFNRSATWYCYIYNAAGTKTSEWRLNDPGPNPVPSDHSCAIGIDGAGALLIARRSSSDAFTINGYSLAGVASAAAGTYPTWAGAEITGVVKVAVDTATVRYVVSSKTSGTRVFNTATAARVSSEEWTTAGSEVRGIGHDGSNFYTHDGAKFWKYTNLIGTWDFAYTWVDNDAGGSGTAETKRSTLRTTAPTKRAKWTISLPSAPPDDGTTDGANTASLYAITTGGTLVRQTALTEGTYSATYSTLATTGTAPPSTNGFATRLGALGRIASTGALDNGGNPLVDIKGDGSWRLGHLSGDASGVGTQDNAFVASTANAAPTSTTNVTIPGLSVTVSSPGTGAAWMVEISADIILAATGGNIVGLLVDGAEQTAVIVSAGATNGRFAACKRWRISGLTAGSHTFTARTRSQGAYTTTALTPSTTMTVERCA